MIYSFSGHRPPTIFKDDPYSEENHNLLVRLAVRVLVKYGVKKAVVGMALGWDQAVADACIATNTPFIAALPFKNHGSNWPKKSQDKHADMLKYAEKVVIRKGYHDRDFWMVDNGEQLIALASGIPSGTQTTVDYAHGKSVPVINVWQEWLDLLKEIENET